MTYLLIRCKTNCFTMKEIKIYKLRKLSIVIADKNYIKNHFNFYQSNLNMNVKNGS